MKIKEYWIENFQSLKGRFDIVCDDSKNLNLLNGSNNGVGKSSVFLNFYFMLCSTTSTNIEEYLNWDSDSMASHLVFEHEGKLFTIDYSYKKGKSEKTLQIDEEKFTGPSSVNKVLKEYFDPSIFTTATAIMQGERNFVKVGNSERREQLKKLFNTDFTKEVKDIDKELKEVFQKEIDAIEKEIISLQAKDFEPKELEPLNADEIHYQCHKDKIEELQKEINRNNISISEADKVSRDYLALKNSIASFESTIEEKNKTLETRNKELISLQEYKKDESNITNWEKELSLIEVKRMGPFNEETLTAKHQEVSDINSTIRELLKKKKDCDNGICPTCNRPLDGIDEHDIEEQKEAIDKEIETLKVKKEILEKEISLILIEKQEYEKLIETNNNNKQKKEVLLTRIENEKKRLETEELNNANFIKQKEESIKDLFSTISSLELELDKAKQDFSKLEIVDVSELKEAKKGLEEQVSKLQEVVNEYDRIVAINQHIEKENEKLVKEKEKNAEDITIAEKKLQDKIFEREELKKVRDILRVEFPSYVISSIISELEESMNEFINSVYYKPLDVKINGSDESIEVLYGTGDRKVSTAHASGAEEALLAISYAYALNKMNGFNILFLDECDSQMNEENAIQFAELILDIKDMYDDIWIISHKTRAKDLYASNDANVVMIA